jgi:preprotein translocase subunit SecB
MEMSLIELRSMEVELVAADLGNPKLITKIEESPDQYKLAYDVIFPSDDLRSFAVVFECAVRVTNLKQLRVVYLGRFETSEDIDEEFKQSHYTGMNAPAICYPFLRSYIGQMLLISGYKPVMLPTMNFQALYNEKKEKALAEQNISPAP